MVVVAFDIAARKGTAPIWVPGGGHISAYEFEQTWPPADGYSVGYPWTDLETVTLGSSRNVWDNYGISRVYLDFDTRALTEQPATALIRLSAAGGPWFIDGGLQAYVATWAEPLTEVDWDSGSATGSAVSGPWTNEDVDLVIDPADVIFGGTSRFVVRGSPEAAPPAQGDHSYFGQFGGYGSIQLIVT